MIYNHSRNPMIKQPRIVIELTGAQIVGLLSNYEQEDALGNDVKPFYKANIQEVMVTFRVPPSYKGCGDRIAITNENPIQVEFNSKFYFEAMGKEYQSKPGEITEVPPGTLAKLARGDN